MRIFTVVIRTVASSFTFAAIGTDSISLHMSMLEHFGACGVTVMAGSKL